MFGSVVQLGRDRSKSWALSLVSLWSALHLLCGCGDGLEVTTEYLDPEPGQPPPASASVDPGVAPTPPAARDGASEPPSSRAPAATPAAPGSPGLPDSSEAGDEGGPVPIALTPVAQVPDSQHCAAVADWDPLWAQFEEEVLLLVNEARSQPADCGEEGLFAPAGPLVMEPVLRCSARLHSLDMFERRFFSHENPDGKDPFERMGGAGFRGSGAAENIAVGQTSPAHVVQSWMDSDDHCSNVMRRSYTLLGVGYHPGLGKRGLGSNFWTQNFGAPPRPCRSCR